MIKILLVYHSQTGHTRKMAEAVYEGAIAIEGTRVLMKKAENASSEDVLWADGIAIGSPENFGYMSGMIKDFFDRTFYAVEKKVFRKPYVTFISADNDGTGALRAIERIATGYRFKKVYEPVIAKGDLTLEDLAKCRELGGVIAAGCRLGIF
jgi:multimeric flavodoxin WrbA